MKKLNYKHIVKLIEVYFTKNNAYLILVDSNLTNRNSVIKEMQKNFQFNKKNFLNNNVKRFYMMWFQDTKKC